MDACILLPFLLFNFTHFMSLLHIMSFVSVAVFSGCVCQVSLAWLRVEYTPDNESDVVNDNIQEKKYREN